MPDDTIVAIATPPGRGGLGVVRLSGNLSFNIVCGLFHLGDSPPEPRQATLAPFEDPQTGRQLDQVIVTCFPSPRSYTGEDVAEISCHGAPVILRYLVECCLAKGARPAEPGEFTLRAFLNQRMDLTQAEAVRDLIDSRTLYQARIAALQMGGSVSVRVRPAKTALVNLIAALEAGIDFAEDDVPVAARETIHNGIDGVQSALQKMAQSYEYGRIVREGLSLAIVGRPNVGKSSLFNRLLNEERAIVTEIPGTTRDLVSETATLDGIPVRLVDTAGIRESGDVVEKIGVERSLAAVADSDLRLLVLDAAEGITEQDLILVEKILSYGPLVIACNKCDLPARLSLEELESLVTAAATRDHLSAKEESQHESVLLSPPYGAPDSTRCDAARANGAWTSALTGQGLGELKKLILLTVAPAGGGKPDGEFITSLRQQQSLQQSIRSLAKADEAAARGVPHEMLLLDLYESLHALDSLTGATTTDDLLGVIFSTFCVGK